MSSLRWYLDRIRAMSPAELAAHGRRKAHQLSDAFRGAARFQAVQSIPEGGSFPVLPPRASVPPSFRDALQRDVEDILKGRWIAFGYLPLQVDDPPRWHKDYLANVELTTDQRPALKLHHRLQGKADIKLIWEPNRWYSLVRLAQGAYLLEDLRAAAACLKWLENWVAFNRPYYGWNWTSGLETGIRLIQFVWIDALLSAALTSPDSQAPEPTVGVQTTELRSRLARLRAGMLLPHLWFTWRDRSFGSSANNHLIGELSGLILALARWPTLTTWAAPLDRIQPLWERQVLTQFTPDGGNREQALNYHLFSWEFCWQARLALKAIGRAIAPQVEDRLRAAASYFTSVQVPEQPWDYGDSDSAYVTPFFTDWTQATPEWHTWLRDSKRSEAISYWLGESPKPLRSPAVLRATREWLVYPETGYAIAQVDNWFLRWDLSPLGYLATAGHGHCDALHLSAWFKGEPVLIDPGTAVYHSHRRLRDYLASWEAHNGPRAEQAPFPARRGTFLWSAHHAVPRWEKKSDLTLRAELTLPNGVMRRAITYLPAENAWQLDDAFEPAPSTPPQRTFVFWQFAPTANLTKTGATEFRLQLPSSGIQVQLDSDWAVVETGDGGAQPSVDGLESLRGACSPAFRQIQRAPYLLVSGTSGPAKMLRTVLRPER